MNHAEQLTVLQIDLAGIFFGLDEAEGYFVTGGAALLASELIARPTEDLDLFTARPTMHVTRAKEAFVREVSGRECDVTIIQDGPTFCRMIVARAGEETLVDLAIDSPPHVGPTVTVLGPTLAPLELGGRKLLALFGRAEARDFADVYVLVQRFGKEALVKEAQALDAGFDVAVLGQMLRTISRFEEDEIPLPQDELPKVFAFFADWASELATQ